MTESAELESRAVENAARSSLSPSVQRIMWCGIALLVAVGCLGLRRDLSIIWMLWTTDPLRSIGMLIPPVSIVLTLRVWRQCGWELRGSWWGIPVLGLAFFMSFLRQRQLLMASLGPLAVSFWPLSLPFCIYGSGVVLLFAGSRVWRNAWFPLLLLLMSQPVPSVVDGLVDIPLQGLAARIARAFATTIHFAPTTPQLRLMFSPNFGMFIAPGCDGMRGAVTMGYMALILGYLKRVSWRRWIAYVAGAVLLGYVFNFIRLCVLVLYYRIALGHPQLENVAKQVDYGIGSCLFLAAILLFFLLTRLKEKDTDSPATLSLEEVKEPGMMPVLAKSAAFVLVLLVALALPAPAIPSQERAIISSETYAALFPKKIGEFTLTRTWYEQLDGIPVEENGAYSAPGSDEILLGVWIAPYSKVHNTARCWLARGLDPDKLSYQSYVTVSGRSFEFRTGLYNDGITDSIVVDAFCTSKSCGQMGHFFLQPQTDVALGSEQHPVSIMIRIDKLHSNESKAANYEILATEAEKFIAGIDPLDLGKTFQ
jgi:exosortase J